jgi:hypothetical protein
MNNTRFGGRGRVTDTIDRLQNYYGIALRQNTNDLNKMKTAILATLFQVSSSAKDNWHSYCPDGLNSWSRYKLDISTSQSTYHPGPGLPMEIIKPEIKPTYNDLSSDTLFSICLHGKTQNLIRKF